MNRDQERELIRNNFKLKLMIGGRGELSYDEAMDLAKQADQFLEDMDPFDPAKARFYRESRIWWEYAYRLNMRDTLGRSDHGVEKAYLVGWESPGTFRSEPRRFTEELSVIVPFYRRGEDPNEFVVQQAKLHFNIPYTYYTSIVVVEV